MAPGRPGPRPSRPPGHALSSGSARQASRVCPPLCTCWPSAPWLLTRRSHLGKLLPTPTDLKRPAGVQQASSFACMESPGRGPRRMFGPACSRQLHNWGHTQCSIHSNPSDQSPRLPAGTGRPPRRHSHCQRGGDWSEKNRQRRGASGALHFTGCSGQAKARPHVTPAGEWRRQRAACCQRRQVRRGKQAALHHPVRLPGLRQDHPAQAHPAQQGGPAVSPARHQQRHRPPPPPQQQCRHR